MSLPSPGGEHEGICAIAAGQFIIAAAAGDDAAVVVASQHVIVAAAGDVFEIASVNKRVSFCMAFLCC